MNLVFIKSQRPTDGMCSCPIAPFPCPPKATVCSGYSFSNSHLVSRGPARQRFSRQPTSLLLPVHLDRKVLGDDRLAVRLASLAQQVNEPTLVGEGIASTMSAADGKTERHAGGHEEGFARPDSRRLSGTANLELECPLVDNKGMMRRGECEGLLREWGVRNRVGALDPRNGELAVRLRGPGERLDEEAAGGEPGPLVCFEEKGLLRLRELAVGVGAWGRFAALVPAHGDHVEFLRRRDELGDQDFKGVAGVLCREQTALVGLADEAEELFPASWYDEAAELGVFA